MIFKKHLILSGEIKVNREKKAEISAFLNSNSCTKLLLVHS